MKHVVVRLRLVVLVLILFGNGLLVWNHFRRNDIFGVAGHVLVIIAFMLALVPLRMFFLTILSAWRSKNGTKE